MQAGLFCRAVLQFYMWCVALVAATLLRDAVLHLADDVWIGRYLGPRTLRPNVPLDA